MTATVMVPLSLNKKLESLARWSLLALFGVLMVGIVVIARGLDTPAPWNKGGGHFGNSRFVQVRSSSVNNRTNQVAAELVNSCDLGHCTSACLCLCSSNPVVCCSGSSCTYSYLAVDEQQAGNWCHGVCLRLSSQHVPDLRQLKRCKYRSVWQSVSDLSWHLGGVDGRHWRGRVSSVWRSDMCQCTYSFVRPTPYPRFRSNNSVRSRFRSLFLCTNCW
jgi:hypothetical protein